jgi:DNA adenine methylase
MLVGRALFLEDYKSMNSFISWIGGKRLLRKAIISRFPEQYDSYIEVFGGAAWVLFGIETPSGFEVYNDIDSDLVKLYRCVKYHCQELQRELDFLLNSREMFNDFKSQMQSTGLTDIQRAARYFIMIKISYGSDRRSFGCIDKNMIKIIDYLPQIQERLNKVLIENRSFDRLIKVYDKPGALFYLDPPYHGTEKYYDTKFDEQHHRLLCDILKGIQGRFVLSYNDDPFIRELYKDFNVESISRKSNLTGKYDNAPHDYKELIIRNY